MLYLAFPQDLRERYRDSIWLVYSKQVSESQFTSEDVLVISEWVVSDRTELLQIVHRARQAGARVIYVGSKRTETDDFKRQLCLMSVYDFLFAGDELVLRDIDELLEHPRTPLDVREYISRETAPSVGEMPTVVDIIGDASEPDESSEKPRSKGGRFGWGPRKGHVPPPPPVIEIVQPHLILVTGLWPRAGMSTIAYLVSKGLAERLPPSSVSCIELPGQLPRMWELFKLDEHGLSPNTYRHWTQDGVGQSVDVEGVGLVPLPPAMTTKVVEPQQLMSGIYRHMRRPLTVIDCGQGVSEDWLLGMADRIVCVLDCDPTYLSVDELGKKYQRLMDKHGERVITVLNKWTRFAKGLDDLFEDAIKVPYLPPELVQQALWNGSFVSGMKDELKALEEHLVNPFVS